MNDFCTYVGFASSIALYVRTYASSVAYLLSRPTEYLPRLSLRVLVSLQEKDPSE